MVTPRTRRGRPKHHCPAVLLASLTSFASGFVQHWGYLAVFLLAGLESLCLPLPSG